MERSNSRKNTLNNRGSGNDQNDDNDTSFVSDSKLLKIEDDSQSQKRKNSVESSMASESLLMYVGDANSRAKSKVPSRRPLSGGTGDGSPKVRTWRDLKLYRQHTYYEYHHLFIIYDCSSFSTLLSFV